MDFDRAAGLIVKLRKEKAAIEAAIKPQVAEINERIDKLEVWVHEKAIEMGLKRVPTEHGTMFWTTIASATVAERTAFFDFCKANDRWDMVQARASAPNVKAYIELTGSVPPGINFATVQNFNLRAGKSADAEITEE